MINFFLIFKSKFKTKIQNKIQNKFSKLKFNSPHGTPLHVAVLAGNSASVLELLRLGALPNIEHKVKNSHGVALVPLAALVRLVDNPTDQHLACAVALISYGALSIQSTQLTGQEAVRFAYGQAGLLYFLILNLI